MMIRWLTTQCSFNAKQNIPKHNKQQLIIIKPLLFQIIHGINSYEQIFADLGSHFGLFQLFSSLQSSFRRHGRVCLTVVVIHFPVKGSHSASILLNSLQSWSVVVVVSIRLFQFLQMVVNVSVRGFRSAFNSQEFLCELLEQNKSNLTVFNLEKLLS